MAGLLYVWSRRRLVAGFAVAVVVLATVFYLVTPDRFTARATLLPPRSAGKLSSLASIAPGLLSAAGASLPAGNATGSDLYPAILHSESVIRPLLRRRFPTSEDTGTESVTLLEITGTRDPQEGVKRVRDLVRATLLRPTGICEIAVTLDDPETAAAVCNAFVDALAARDVELHTAGAARIRRFLAGRLDTVGKELKDAEQRLEAFRTQNRNFLQTTDPEMQLADARLQRDVTLKSQLYLQLSQEYEMARIEENRNVADIRILDVAEVPTVRSGPHRWRATVMAGTASVPVAVMLLLVWHFLVWTLSRRFSLMHVPPGEPAAATETNRRETATERSHAEA